MTLRTLLHRINRKLRIVDCQVRKAAQGCDSALGPYCAVSLSGNYIVEQDVDPEVMGRELGVLRLWEKVVPAILALGLVWR